jgi:protease IV
MNAEQTSSTNQTSARPTFLAGIGAVFKAVFRLWVVVTAVIGTLIVVGFGAMILALSQAESPEVGQTPLSQKIIKKAGDDKIAVIRLEGPISDSDSAGSFAGPSQSVSATRVIKVLDKLAEDDEVKAVILRINSPGGTVVASDEIYRRVRELQKDKVVVASLSDMAASGGYYIAVGANKIVANPATITGSIGVIAQFPKLQGLYDKIGVEMRTFKSGEFKDIGSESRDLTESERQILDSIVKDSYDQFVKTVSEGRNMDEAKVRELADGRIYSGVQAKENGLVDELGDFQTAITTTNDLAKLNNPSVVEYSDQSFFEALLSAQAKRFNFGVNIDGIVPQHYGVMYLWDM